ncbi:unnamed protein product [Thlaspi arvense]|uniref:DUF547 domain-containing protein n=1 Tax=Thlaspi arvense TaxID=13288 RepID=A0AAU9RSC8_THLAR|nr:unnamed protein product [Thlaspi arvense]
MQGKKLKGGENGVVKLKALNRQKIIALEQDVEKLRKKLRLEENIHRAIERAFNRPLGTLPRLPPFLPPQILELLAEVAVLEEEIVRMIYDATAFFLESLKGKNNKLTANSTIKMEAKKMSFAHTQLDKSLGDQKLQECPMHRKGRSSRGADENCDPNKISEDLVKCLSNIYMRMSSVKSHGAVRKSQENSKDNMFRDPYGICSSFRRRDIGPYKSFINVQADSINRNRMSSSSAFLIRRLNGLLERLSSVNLKKLNQQEKLAFWINIYNSCMMNGFLEHGIAEIPEMVVRLMRKAIINVGGHFLNAITIEHFILRLPFHSNYSSPIDSKENEVAARSKFVLEFSEPLVTFALSCGSWSSPAQHA